jgi:hypothetical protein
MKTAYRDPASASCPNGNGTNVTVPSRVVEGSAVRLEVARVREDAQFWEPLMHPIVGRACIDCGHVSSGSIPSNVCRATRVGSRRTRLQERYIALDREDGCTLVNSPSYTLRVLMHPFGESRS